MKCQVDCSEDIYIYKKKIEGRERPKNKTKKKQQTVLKHPIKQTHLNG